MSADQRLLGSEDAELVALRIGQHGPRLVARLPDVHSPGTKSKDAPDLCFPIVGPGVATRVEVEVDTVLDRLLVTCGIRQIPTAAFTSVPMTTSRSRSERIRQPRT
jgi:hypothetical protein